MDLSVNRGFDRPDTSVIYSRLQPAGFMTIRGEITRSAQEVDAGSREDSTTGMPPLLPTSQNGPSGHGRVEAFWNSFSCDPSIAVLQSVPAFPARMIHGGSTAGNKRRGQFLTLHLAMTEFCWGKGN